MICASRYMFICIWTRFQLNEGAKSHIILDRSQRMRSWLQALLVWLTGEV